LGNSVAAARYRQKQLGLKRILQPKFGAIKWQNVAALKMTEKSVQTCNFALFCLYKVHKKPCFFSTKIGSLAS